MIAAAWVLLTAVVVFAFVVGRAVLADVRRQRAIDRLEQQRLIGVPERRRIARPDVSDRPQIPQRGDGGRP